MPEQLENQPQLIETLELLLQGIDGLNDKFDQLIAIKTKSSGMPEIEDNGEIIPDDVPY